MYLGGVSELMRIPLLVVAAVVFALGGATAAARSSGTVAEPFLAAKNLPPVLGISYRSPRGTLAWFDPLTLRMLPGRKAPLGGHIGSWAFSGDRAMLAIAKCSEEEIPGIRFVNARTMRVLGDLRLSPYRGCADALTWLRPDRLLAVIPTPGQSELAVVDTVTRRVLHREPLPEAWSIAIGRTWNELVLLLAAPGEIATACLAVVDAEGTTRVASVDGVLAGTVVDEGSIDYRSRSVIPGLAVDPDGRRALLVPASGAVAEIDLRTLAVIYRELDRPSLLQRFVRWLTPAAQAKIVEGPVRDARWLGDGMIAVSGMDYSIAGIAQLEVATPVGLSLIDTRTWTSRMLSREASGFAVAPGLVIAQGGRWDPQMDRGYGPGLVAFGLDGRERWRLHPGEYRWMDPAGSVGYAYVAEGSAEVVDLTTGLVIATVRWDERNPLPQLLAAQTSSW